MLWSLNMKWLNKKRRLRISTGLFYHRHITSFVSKIKRLTKTVFDVEAFNKFSTRMWAEKKSCVWIHWISRKINNQNVCSWNAKTSICYCSSGGISEINAQRMTWNDHEKKKVVTKVSIIIMMLHELIISFGLFEYRSMLWLVRARTNTFVNTGMHAYTVAIHSNVKR